MNVHQNPAAIIATVAGAGVADAGDQQLGDAAEAEAAGGDEYAVEEQAVERLGGVGVDLLHWRLPLSRGLCLHSGCAERCQGLGPRGVSAPARPEAASSVAEGIIVPTVEADRHETSHGRPAIE